MRLLGEPRASVGDCSAASPLSSGSLRFSPHWQAVNVLTLTGTWAPGMAVATSSCGELVLRKRAGALGGALGAVEYVSFVGDLTATMHSERDGGPVVPHRWTHPFL